jgi:hypothetical protein
VGRLIFVANKLLAPQNVRRLFFYLIVAIKLFTPQNVGKIFLVTRLKLRQISDLLASTSSFVVLEIHEDVLLTLVIRTS